MRGGKKEREYITCTKNSTSSSVDDSAEAPSRGQNTIHFATWQRRSLCTFVSSDFTNIAVAIRAPSAHEVIARMILATCASRACANVTTTRRVLAASEPVPMSILALGSPTLARAICCLRDGERHTSIDATFAAWGSAHIPAAGAAVAANEIMAFRIETAGAAFARAYIPAA